MNDVDSNELDLEDLFKSIDLSFQSFTFHDFLIELDENDVTSSSINFIFHYREDGRITIEDEEDIILIESIIKIKRNVVCNSSLIINRSIFNIGMCVLTWYWMGFGTKNIILSNNIIQKCELNQDMIDFWDIVFNNVLLEYLYVNNLTFHINIIPELPFQSAEDFAESSKVGIRIEKITSSPRKVIVPLGGGKDSLVVWHMIKQSCNNPVLVYVADGLFEYQNNWRLSSIVNLTQSEFALVRHDFYCPSFVKYARSYLKPCGHPWAALVLFDSVLVAVLDDIPEIVLGHEKSADEGNGVFVNNVEVNHQYDKSSMFLSIASDYSMKYITSQLIIRSALTQLWELQIAKIFCDELLLKPYHSLFLSCNEPIHGTEWCKSCEKCMFIFLLLSSYMKPNEIISIFGEENLFENISLECKWRNLLGLVGTKPFDCVGTVEIIEKLKSFYVKNNNETEIKSEKWNGEQLILFWNQEN
eukprot:gene9134-12320_t